MILWSHILIKWFYRVALGAIKSKKSYLLQELRNRLLKSVTKYVTLASWPGRAGSCLESIQNWKSIKKCFIQNCSTTNIKDFIALFEGPIWLRRMLSLLAIMIYIYFNVYIYKYYNSIWLWNILCILTIKYTNPVIKILYRK